MQGEHWIMIANSCQIWYFADSLGLKKYSFLKQQYEQMTPKPLQSHPSVCCFYRIAAASHLFKFRQEAIRGVRDVNDFHSSIITSTSSISECKYAG